MLSCEEFLQLQAEIEDDQDLASPELAAAQATPAEREGDLGGGVILADQGEGGAGGAVTGAVGSLGFGT